MYDDSWYNYVPESRAKKVATAIKNETQHRTESLLKQTNGNDEGIHPPDSIMGLFEAGNVSKGPPEATLARRAKSYSDFYEVAIDYLSKESNAKVPRDTLEPLKQVRNRDNPAYLFEEFEGAFLDECHAEYQLYQDQLTLSERHLDSLLSDTTAALDLLATLSESFKSVELETTAFQSQCEDLLAEQKRLRTLADEVGTDLQYYAYLEPLTRRLNAPGAGRLVKSDDFLDMLLNLNTCIDFMESHPNYRDSTVYKTRYLSLLDRALNLVQIVFSTALREATEEVTKELRSKEHTETAEYVLLYGKYETVHANLGLQVQSLLTMPEFAFGQYGDNKANRPYTHRYHEVYNQLVEAYIKNREPAAGLVSKNLKKYSGSEKPDTDFESFARLCIQHVLDICHNEQNLVTRYFHNGPLLADYQPLEAWNKSTNYAGKLENVILSHLEPLYNFLLPYLSNGDLQRVCGLVNWLETMYMTSVDNDMDMDRSQDGRWSIAQAFLSKFLWKLLDTLFLKAASEIELFKPSQEDLRISVNAAPLTGERKKAVAPSDGEKPAVQDVNMPLVSNTFPTVKTAISLLGMYNEGIFDRPRSSDVLYEIVHQVTESLQKAATTIKRTSGMMDAQLFLIKNMMLIENLFMTQEIPDVVRQSAEFDFSPIWETIKELQDRKQILNPLAYISPLARGRLLPAVIDRVLDARKDLEKVLVQQVTGFTKTWQSRLADKDSQKREAVERELEALLNKVFDDETTRAALWKMIQANE